MRTAILVDGGFYRKRAAHLWGKKTPEKRAMELIAYCSAHLKHEKQFDDRGLYRIFYYDCPPLAKTVYHPLLKKGIDFRHSETYEWTTTFFETLKKQRKVALRLGELSDSFASFNISTPALKDICSGKKQISDLTEKDFSISFQQKGVDMRIGIDIASLVYKKQVDQIILIAGDSDFVPAAKMARREGIDFILDPMWATIKDDLFEHIDGLRSQWKKKTTDSDK
ncbi:MAG: NYN domain-containing protein [Lachnospiraceae bacterium]